MMKRSTNKDGVEAERALIVFIKNPEKGKVKTRLAAESTEEFALDVYKHLININLEMASRSAASLFLYYSKRLPDFLPIELAHAQLRVQQGVDLGERMNSAFAEVLALHKCACIIGTDCPYITTDLIDKAFVMLQKSDIVIGPAVDGGYYLLGMNILQSEVFKDIYWSSSSVFEKTMMKAAESDITVTLLPTLADIDHLKDWEEYISTSER